MSDSWYGFKCIEFEFEGQDAKLVFPEPEVSNGRLAIKTEYWGAFPDIEINLLRKGFHLAYIKNKTRFATKEDCDIKASFIKHLSVIISGILPYITAVDDRVWETISRIRGRVSSGARIISRKRGESSSAVSLLAIFRRRSPWTVKPAPSSRGR